MTVVFANLCRPKLFNDHKDFQGIILLSLKVSPFGHERTDFENLLLQLTSPINYSNT